MLPDLLRTDAGVSLLGAGILVGYLSGLAFTVMLFWRRITKPTVAEEVRQLQTALDDMLGHNKTLLKVNDELARHLKAAQLQLRCTDTRSRGQAMKGAA